MDLSTTPSASGILRFRALRVVNRLRLLRSFCVSRPPGFLSFGLPGPCRISSSFLPRVVSRFVGGGYVGCERAASGRLVYRDHWGEPKVSLYQAPHQLTTTFGRPVTSQCPSPLDGKNPTSGTWMRHVRNWKPPAPATYPALVNLPVRFSCLDWLLFHSESFREWIGGGKVLGRKRPRYAHVEYPHSFPDPSLSLRDGLSSTYPSHPST